MMMKKERKKVRKKKKKKQKRKCQKNKRGDIQKRGIKLTAQRFQTGGDIRNPSASLRGLKTRTGRRNKKNGKKKQENRKKKQEEQEEE